MSSSRMASQSGLRWSLYPMLAIVALVSEFGYCFSSNQQHNGNCEFALGVCHLTLCMPLFPFLIPVISGVFALITAMHAIFLRYPNRTDFVLQCCSSFIAFILVISSAMETFCAISYEDELQGSSTSLTTGICYGFSYRTAALRDSCNDFLTLLHTSLASKTGIAPHLSSLRFAISLSITALATIHFVTCIALAFYSAVETYLPIRAHHIQLVVVLLMLPAAFLHHTYCCTYFFFWPGIVVSLYATIQSIFSWKFDCKGCIIRALNITGAAIGMALAASASFGIFCTATRLATDLFTFQWHCKWPISQYRYCYRVIDFRDPYRYWRKENVIAETAAVQIAVSIWLCICGFAQFFLSLKSSFSTDVFV
uniref:MARVEL domain-containing protein n=1 Tax=Ascaris lumbricoides TaxID=6252 RepID=A0A0M3HVL7_ASCLU